MIRKKIAPFKPSVDKRALILLSALVWIVVGTLFLMASFSWLSDPPATGWALFAGMGVAAALVIHHFGFLKVVDKNLGRILPMEGKRCLFSFMTWKSYIMVFFRILVLHILSHALMPLVETRNSIDYEKPYGTTLSFVSDRPSKFVTSSDCSPCRGLTHVVSLGPVEKIWKDFGL